MIYHKHTMYYNPYNHCHHHCVNYPQYNYHQYYHHYNHHHHHVCYNDDRMLENNINHLKEIFATIKQNIQLKFANKNKQWMNEKYQSQLQQLTDQFHQVCSNASSIVNQINQDLSKTNGKLDYTPRNRKYRPTDDLPRPAPRDSKGNNISNSPALRSSYFLNNNNVSSYDNSNNEPPSDIDEKVKLNMDPFYKQKSNINQNNDEDTSLDEAANNLIQFAQENRPTGKKYKYIGVIYNRTNNHYDKHTDPEDKVPYKKNLKLWVMSTTENINQSKLLEPDLDGLIENDNNKYLKYLKQEPSQKNENKIKEVKDLDDRVRGKTKKKYGPYYKRIRKRSKNMINLKDKNSSAINNIKK